MPAAERNHGHTGSILVPRQVGHAAHTRLGEQPFHNRIVVLVNEWTNSGRDGGCFMAENRLQ